MTDKINLKDMEKRAHKLLNEDGMMELLMGAILFVSSTSFSGTASFTPFLGLYVVFMKTEERLFEEVAKHVKRLHSYEIPEIIALPIIKGFKPYLEWISKNLAGE